MNLPSLAGFPVDELISRLAPLPPYRCKQIFSWLRAGAASFDEMTNIPLALRRELAEHWMARSTRALDYQQGEDGSVKIQVGLAGGNRIEAVLLQDGQGRKTACLSTQAGCAAGCVFCKTGSLGFARNLTASEIAEQYYHLEARAGGRIANIVFMGMGEPLLNLDELFRAIAVLAGDFSKRRITVSTSGVIEGIRALAYKEPRIRLAVSVPSAREELRGLLMPAGAPLELLKDALKDWQRVCGKRLTVETTLFAGVNTGEADAAALSAFTGGLKVMINLIPWNPVAGLMFRGELLKRPSAAESARFQKMLLAKGLRVSVRREKGGTLLGACGQLG